MSPTLPISLTSSFPSTLTGPSVFPHPITGFHFYSTMGTLMTAVSQIQQKYNFSHSVTSQPCLTIVITSSLSFVSCQNNFLFSTTAG